MTLRAGALRPSVAAICIAGRRSAPPATASGNLAAADPDGGDEDGPGCSDPQGRRCGAQWLLRSE